MVKFIIKRLSQALIVIFLVSVFSFSLIRMAPGNPAMMMLPSDASNEDIQAMEIKLGLDRPFYEQYFRYIRDVLRGDLGTSIRVRLPVFSMFKERIPYTAQLTLYVVIFACCLCIPLGILAGSNRGKPADFFAMFFALLGQSMSSIWLGVLLIFVFAVELQWLPALGAGGFINMVTMGYPMAAEITRVGRSGMIDTLSEDYITAAYAKGVRRLVVNWKYAFRNAMIPIITIIGLSIGTHLSGSLIVEQIFSLPGLGQMMYMGINQRDYPVVQSMILISSIIITMINLLVDIINSLIDPRVSLN